MISARDPLHAERQLAWARLAKAEREAELEVLAAVEDILSRCRSHAPIIKDPELMARLRNLSLASEGLDRAGEAIGDFQCGPKEDWPANGGT